MGDKRGYRPWVKVRLSDRREALQVAQVVDSWREQRVAGQKITDAILLYDALQAGDISKLYEMFPVMARANFGSNASTPQPITPPPSARRTKSKVVYEEPDDDTAIDDILDLF